MFCLLFLKKKTLSSFLNESFSSASDTYDPVMKTSSDEEPVPVMMTFKKFLATQDDSITDEEAIAKYSEYKLQFKRQELHKFFLAHKDEEWWVMA